MSMTATEGSYVPPGYVQDTNQALFDLKVDLARVEDSVLATVRTEIRGAERRLTERMDGLETRMDDLDARMDRFETRMDGLEARMERVESKLDLVLEQLAGRA